MRQPLSVIEEMPERDFQRYYAFVEKTGGFADEKSEIYLAQLAYYLCENSGRYKNLTMDKFLIKPIDKTPKQPPKPKKKAKRFGFWDGKRF